jgi:hypothetical protein
MAMGFYPLLNSLDYFIHAAFYFHIVKTQKSDSERLQARLAYKIISECFDAHMTFSVDFNGQLELFAIKIHDIRINGPLPVEVKSQHFLLLQFIPQQNFRKGHVGTEHSGQ